MYDVNRINSNKERLSAILDGENTDLFLLDQDVALEDDWKNYHLIGDVMRGENILITDSSFAESVMAQLENEPDYHQNICDQDDNLVPLFKDSPCVQSNRTKRWLSQVTQIGVAASVAVAVILGVQSYNGGASQQIATQQPHVLNTIPFSGSAEPVSLTRNDLQTRAEAKSSSEAIHHQERQKINALLQDYELQLRLNNANNVDQINQ